jgi:hypothetical protein
MQSILINEKVLIIDYIEPSIDEMPMYVKREKTGSVNNQEWRKRTKGERFLGSGMSDFFGWM